MKALRIAAAAAVAAAALGFGTSQSAYAKPSTYSTGFQITNLSGTKANVTANFYPEGSSTPSATVPIEVDPQGVKGFATLPSQVSAGFQGAAVLSSDQKIAAIVNVIGNGDFNYGASYSGFTSGSKTVGLPLLFKATAGFDTFYSVQNVGSTVASVSITYNGVIASSGAPVNVTDGPHTIQPGSAKKFDQSTEAKLPAGFVGSATLTTGDSGPDIVASVIEVDAATMLSYNGFTSNVGSQFPAFPLINTNSFGFQTGIGLQNLGSQDTQVTLSYTPSSAAAGTACTETQTIKANSTSYFAINAFVRALPGENCVDGKLFVGTARVTANTAGQPLVGIVNQLNSASKKGGSYNGFNPDTGTATVVYPLIQDRVFGYFTGISVMNVGDAPVTISCTFANTSYVASSTGAVAPGAAFTIDQNNKIGQTYNGSGVCTATSSDNTKPAKIVGIYNQLKNGTTTDSFFVAEGANS